MSTLTLNTRTAAPAARPNTVTPAAKPRTSQKMQTLVQKGDMIAVVALMVSSAAYGIYAITQMTGF